MNSFRFATQSADQTKALGEAFGRLIKSNVLDAPLVVFLTGDLGAGKTTFVSGVMRGFGVSGAIRSPTYTLIEPYDLGDHRVYHLDLYRLADPSELEMLGLRDLLEKGATLLVEWPERGGDALPPADVELHLSYEEAESSRVLDLIGNSPSGEALAASLQPVFNEVGVST